MLFHNIFIETGRSPKNTPKVSGRIVNPDPYPSNKEYPWIAALFLEQKTKSGATTHFGCTGVVIGKRYEVLRYLIVPY